MAQPTEVMFVQTVKTAIDLPKGVSGGKLGATLTMNDVQVDLPANASVAKVTNNGKALCSITRDAVDGLFKNLEDRSRYALPTTINAKTGRNEKEFEVPVRSTDANILGTLACPKAPTVAGPFDRDRAVIVPR
jgi:hypothetical protein